MLAPAEREAAERTFGGIIGEADALVFEESGEGRPTPEQVVGDQNGQLEPESVVGLGRSAFWSLRAIVSATSRQSDASISLLASSARWQAIA